MKFRKLVAMFAVLAMVTALMAGCGGSSDSGSDSAESEEVLHLGGIGPITGPAALYGVAVENGAKLAVDEINAANPDGLQLSFDMQDDEHDAEKSVNAYNKLLDDGMQVLIGTVTTAPCTAVAAEAFEDRVFALTPSASGASVVDGNDNVFQMCFQDPQMGHDAAEYIMENYPDAKVGIIYNNSDNYSTGIYEMFKKTYEDAGKTIVATEAFASDDNADFTAQLNSMKDAEADMLFLPIYYTPASNIMTQADKMGYEATYFGVDGMDGILGLEGFDTALAEGTLLLCPFSAASEDEATQKFVKAYEDAYGETPIQFAADAYDCVYAVYEAFQTTDCSASDDAATICEALIKAFVEDGFSYSGLTGEDMQWEAGGAVNKAPRIFEIADGAYSEK